METGLSRYDSKRMGKYDVMVAEGGRPVMAYTFILTTFEGKEYKISRDERDSIVLAMRDEMAKVLELGDDVIPIHQIKGIEKRSERISYVIGGLTVYDEGTARTMAERVQGSYSYSINHGEVVWQASETGS